MPEDGKRIVNEETIVATEQDSAPAETPEVNMDAIENNASEMGNTLPLVDDVASTQLDWSDMKPLEEFDQIANKRGVGARPPAEGESLTDSMSKRISKMKQQEQQLQEEFQINLDEGLSFHC